MGSAAGFVVSGAASKTPFWIPCRQPAIHKHSSLLTPAQFDLCIRKDPN